MAALENAAEAQKGSVAARVYQTLKQHRTYSLFVVLAALAMALALASLLLGSGSHVSLASWLKGELTSAEQLFVWQFRMPRVVAAACVGALMAAAGTLLQNITRNPLADPSLLGVTQGACLAVVVLVVLFPESGGTLKMLAALIGGLAVAVFLFGLSPKDESQGTLKLVLMGVGVSAFLAALISALLTYGDLHRAVSALAWMAGALDVVSPSQAIGLALCLAVLVPAFWASMNVQSALSLGAEVAASLGVPRYASRGLIALAVVAASVAVAVVGPLSFVGLIAPHLVRRLGHFSVQAHLYLASLTGAILVMAADLLGRIAFVPYQVPAGIVTALLGAPLFLWLLVQTRKLS